MLRLVVQWQVELGEIEQLDVELAMLDSALVHPLPDQMADPRRTRAADDDSEFHRRPSLPSLPLGLLDM